MVEISERHTCKKSGKKSGDSGGVVYGRGFAVEVHLFECMVVGQFAVWPTRCIYVQKKPNAMH